MSSPDSVLSLGANGEDGSLMPRIAEFYGVAIYMYFGDHAPPHFHAIYAQFEAEVEISTGNILKGRLPKRAQRLVREWSRSYRGELTQNWERAQLHLPLRTVPPLE